MSLVNLGVYVVSQGYLLSYLPNTEEGNTQKFNIVVGMPFSLVISLLLIKVIWSAYVRLANNDTILVMHGITAAVMMSRNQQGNNRPGLAVARQALDEEIELK